MDQPAFEKSRAGESQCAKILRCLKATPGKWIPMPHLARISGAYAVHSRIADLRKRGHAITQRSVRKPNGRIASAYRLTL